MPAGAIGTFRLRVCLCPTKWYATDPAIRGTQTQDSVTVVCLTARGIADFDGAMSHN